MGISAYIKEIGRGKDGARSLNREQAADLWGQLLDGSVSDLEVGAFCLAMRIKGETPEEMAGFLDATHRRMPAMTSASGQPVVVIPSYNGARKLPVLTPLLALLLAREGLPVLLHGTPTETARTGAADVLTAMGIARLDTPGHLQDGQAAFIPTGVLNQGLQKLLEVRRVVGLRNSAHSLVKLMNPVQGKRLLVTSYTHPEYRVSMSTTLQLVGDNALLLRGTEGEAVADLRRMPQMDGFIGGRMTLLQEAKSGSLNGLPDIPASIDADTTARHIEAILAGKTEVPAPVARQVELIVGLCQQL